MRKLEENETCNKIAKNIGNVCSLRKRKQQCRGNFSEID